MGWRHAEKPTTVKCTRALVKEFAEMEGAPHDRNLSATRQGFIKSMVVEGRFRLADFASVKCNATGKTYRVNGKHTSMVLNELNGEFPRDLFAIVERYEADNLEDVAKLYATFDHRRCVRSTADINKSFAATHPDLAEIAHRIINTCATGLAYSLWEDSYCQHESDERAALLLAHPQFVMWVHFLIQGHNANRHPLMRGAVVGAMFRCFSKNQKQATDFWELVRDESHPNNLHPTRTLSRWLNKHAMRTGAKKSPGQDSPRGMYVRCIHAWNAFREGVDSLSELKYFTGIKTPTVK